MNGWDIGAVILVIILAVVFGIPAMLLLHFFWEVMAAGINGTQN